MLWALQANTSTPVVSLQSSMFQHKSTFFGLLLMEMVISFLWNWTDSKIKSVLTYTVSNLILQLKVRLGKWKQILVDFTPYYATIGSNTIILKETITTKPSNLLSQASSDLGSFYAGYQNCSENYVGRNWSPTWWWWGPLHPPPPPAYPLPPPPTAELLILKTFYVGGWDKRKK